MRINGIETGLRQVCMEKVDGAFIIHDNVSKKIVQLNETASFVWEIIIKRENAGSDDDVTTAGIVKRVMEEYAPDDAGERGVFEDVERILRMFVEAGMLAPRGAVGINIKKGDDCGK
jgi:hypothetical protein